MSFLSDKMIASHITTQKNMAIIRRFPHYWPFVHEMNPPVPMDYPHKRPFIYSLLLAWTNSRVVDDSRRHDTYVTLLYWYKLRKVKRVEFQAMCVIFGGGATKAPIVNLPPWDIAALGKRWITFIFGRHDCRKTGNICQYYFPNIIMWYWYVVYSIGHSFGDLSRYIVLVIPRNDWN